MSWNETELREIAILVRQGNVDGAAECIAALDVAPWMKQRFNLALVNTIVDLAVRDHEQYH